MKLIYDNLGKTKEMLLQRGESPQIPLKMLPRVNRKIWGLHPKKLTIIGARTSQGKSALALQIAFDTASQGISTLFLSLEMYEEDIVERMFCLSEKVDNFDLLSGKFKEHEAEWEAFKEKIENYPLVITDMLGKTWEEIDTYLRSIETKPKVIIIDHLQEAKNANSKGQKEAIEEYLKNLRILAIRNNIALVICSQINRSSQTESAGTEPQLHHLKSSGYIEECADFIILLHWPWHYTKKGDKNKFILNIAKNRNGRTGWEKVRYRPEYYWFYEEVDPEEETEKKDWDN